MLQDSGCVGFQDVSGVRPMGDSKRLPPDGPLLSPHPSEPPVKIHILVSVVLGKVQRGRRAGLWGLLPHELGLGRGRVGPAGISGHGRHYA